jgi:hypothetical protein
MQTKDHPRDHDEKQDLHLEKAMKIDDIQIAGKSTRTGIENHMKVKMENTVGETGNIQAITDDDR